MYWLVAGLLLGVAAGGQPWEAVPRTETITWPTDMTQTEDGFLWIASRSQVFRYDGRTLEPYGDTHGLIGRGVNVLATDGAGTLLAGTNEGLYRLEGNRFRRVLEGHVVSVAVSRTGLVAVNGGGTRLLLGKGEGEEWRWNEVTLPLQLAGQVSFDREGALLLGCGVAICEASAAALERWQTLAADGIKQTVPRLSGGVLPGQGISIVGIARDRWGRVWVRDQQRLYVGERMDGVFALVLGARAGSGTGSPVVRISRAGLAYVNGTQGVGIGNRKGEVEWLTGASDPVTFAGSVAYWDNQGLMWTGKGGTGLLRRVVTGPLYRAWGEAEGLDTPVYGILARKEKPTLAGTLRGIYELEAGGNRWRPVAETVERFGAALAMGEAKDGSVLFGANRGPPTLVRLGTDGRVKGTYLVPPVLDGPNVYSMVRDRKGFWWIGSSRRLYRGYERGTNVEIEPVPQPGRLLANDIFALDLDERGRLVVPTRQGLMRLDGAQWEHWTKQDGFLHDRFGLLARDGRGRYWIGYLGLPGVSVARLEGAKPAVEHVADEAGFGSLQDVLGDRRGWIWLSDERGLWVNRSGGLEKAAFTRVGAEIRQIAGGVNRTALHEDEEGRIWASGSAGTIRIDDPEAFVEQAGDVPKLTVSGWEFSGTAGGPLRAQLHAPRLRGMEKVRFRWRFEGGEWKVSEDGAVRMEGVPEGEHTFEAEAEHREGYWRGETLRQPVWAGAPWWRSRGFVWPVALVLLGTGYVWRRRKDRLEEEIRAFGEARLAHFRRQEKPLFGGRYQAVEMIAKGTFARVYRAIDEETGREVAVKALQEEAEEETRIRKNLEREVENLRRISHPGVVGVLDFGLGEEEGAYLVLEYVAGPTLRDELAKGRMDRRRVGKLARQLGEALGAAHTAGVIHRDLKPANIILRREGEEERAVIVDFGIAVWREPGKSKVLATQVGGTPMYWAPEQLAGAARPSADIYSFGVIVCEALTGECPAVKEDGVLEKRAAAARLLMGEDDVAELVGKAMAYDPAQRPKDAAELGVELERRLG